MDDSSAEKQRGLGKRSQHVLSLDQLSGFLLEKIESEHGGKNGSYITVRYSLSRLDLPALV